MYLCFLDIMAQSAALANYGWPERMGGVWPALLAVCCVLVCIDSGLKSLRLFITCDYFWTQQCRLKCVWCENHLGLPGPPRLKQSWRSLNPTSCGKPTAMSQNAVDSVEIFPRSSCSNFLSCWSLELILSSSPASVFFSAQNCPNLCSASPPNSTHTSHWAWKRLGGSRGLETAIWLAALWYVRSNEQVS